jgi:hypothetical protein
MWAQKAMEASRSIAFRMIADKMGVEWVIPVVY